MPVRISKNRVALENVPLNLASEVDVASASTTNIGAALSNNVRITGTTTITAFDTVSAGIIRFIRFGGALTLTHNSTTLKLPGGSNITTALDDRAIARSFGSGNWEIFDYQKASGEPVVGSGNAYNLTNLIYPRGDGDWRGIYRSGWRPSFFNQQWGGAQWGNGPDGSFVDFASGYINDSVSVGAAISETAANTWRAQGFKVSENISLAAVWVKIYKVGNATNGLVLRILPDDGSGTKPSGSTPITNGTATLQNGRLHASNTNGEWVRYVFPTPPSLTANTFYHISLTTDGTVSASNYWAWKYHGSSKKYPHGNLSYGDGTPTWTASTTDALMFLIEPVTKFLQPSGQFSGKLVFAEGSPLDQSKGLSQPLKNFFDSYEFTYRGVFTTLTKDKTIADFLYGFDHDRIVLRCNATTGYLQVDVYETDGTKHTVTGTTDCSTGTKDIAIYVRAKGDGSDSVKLYVNGISEGTPVSSATITFDPNFKDLGTAWLGGGFPLAPTWTKDTAMSTLPSADGWTYGGVATEGSAFSVSGGKLYQNKNGYAATDEGYYGRSVSLSNTNGWVVATKLRIAAGENTSGYAASILRIHDGTKQCNIYFHDYFVDVLSGGDAVSAQVNLTDREHVFVLVGKGTDLLVFMDGRLLVDFTGKMTTADTLGNVIRFGDLDTSSGRNADAVWDYVKDYNTAWLPPQFTAGSLSEAAFFSGDRTSILPSLYNGGILKSVREYCGIEREYVGRVTEEIALKGITSGPNTTSTSFIAITDMEAFVIGEEINAALAGTFYNTAAGNGIHLTVYIDGKQVSEEVSIDEYVANYRIGMAAIAAARIFSGMHKLEGRFKQVGGTATAYTTQRTLIAEAK